MSRKWIFCASCAGKHWFMPSEARGKYRCLGCDGEVSLIDAKRVAKADKVARRAEKIAGAPAKKKRPPAKQPKRVIDRAYFLWIKGHYCLVCGKFPVDAHHHTLRSQGGSDRTCVPLCHPCHMELHSSGVETFEGRHAIDLAASIERLNEDYDAGDDSPMSHAVPAK